MSSQEQFSPYIKLRSRPHDEPYGESFGPEPAKQMMERVYIKYPDLHVTVEDTMAEDTKVMVRNVWRGTDSSTGKKIEFKGFVLRRLAGGKIVERWATITPPTEVELGNFAKVRMSSSCCLSLSN